MVADPSDCCDHGTFGLAAFAPAGRGNAGSDDPAWVFHAFRRNIESVCGSLYDESGCSMEGKIDYRKMS